VYVRRVVAFCILAILTFALRSSSKRLANVDSYRAEKVSWESIPFLGVVDIISRNKVTVVRRGRVGGEKREVYDKLVGGRII
jgi:hypothetical protein